MHNYFFLIKLIDCVNDGGGLECVQKAYTSAFILFFSLKPIFYYGLI